VSNNQRQHTDIGHFIQISLTSNFPSRGQERTLKNKNKQTSTVNQEHSKWAVISTANGYRWLTAFVTVLS